MLMRYRVLLGAVLMQMCLGATYSWSVYVHPIREMTGLLQGPVQIPFTVFYFAFPAVTIVAGNILDRLGPQRSAVTGGLLFGSGWILAGQGHVHFILTVMGIGILGGIGVGLAYMVPISVGIRWFPRSRGLVTGVSVAGFGGGAALVSQAASLGMTRYNATPFEVLEALGAVFLILVVLAGSQMKYPTENANTRLKPLPISAIVTRKTFWILYVAMLAALAAGFAVNANLKELSRGHNLQTGVTAVSLFALANASGRILWGWICDRVPPVAVVCGNLLLQSAVLLGSAVILEKTGGPLNLALLTGLNYGGVLVIYAASAARLWGASHVGRVYGLIFSANIPAALSPILTGMAYDRTGSFAGAMGVLSLLMSAAAGYVWVNREALIRKPRSG